MTLPARDSGGQPATASDPPGTANAQPAPASDQPATAERDEIAAPNAYVIDEIDKAATVDAGGEAAGAGSTARAGMPADAGSPAEAGPSVEAVAGDRWRDITAMFVDDPRGSVAEASLMVEEAVEALITSARERQESLAASWQAPDADTERLRRALQAYRAFWATVAQLPQPA